MAGLIDIINKAGPHSILVGDFNLPGINWRQGTATGRAQEFLAATENKFMEQLVDFPTQVKGNTLDLVLTNAGELIDNITAEGRLGKSDHEIICIHLNSGKPPPAADLRKPNWNRADWESMKRDLASTDWYRTLERLDTESAWSTIKNRINSLISRYVPVRKVRPPNRPVWMTMEISRAMDRKRRLWRRKAPPEEYKEAEKKVRNLVRNAKRNFEKKLARNNGNSKPFYSYLKNKTQSRSGIGPISKGDDSLTSNPSEMAEILNKFFSSVFTEDNPTEETPRADRNSTNFEKLTDMSFSVRDTRLLINKLKTDGSPGPDKITAKLLQQVAWEISPPLTILFRKSLAEGVVPEDWRLANVTPIYKKGKKTEPGNYRPVSLTSICGKLMEAHIKLQITKHLTDNNMMRSSQHGFISGRSCTTNLLHFLEILTKAVDEGNNVDVGGRRKQRGCGLSRLL